MDLTTTALSRRDLAKATAVGLAGIAGLTVTAGQAWAAAPTYRTVSASVAGLWRSPTSPRRVDALAVRRRPDIAGWLRRLDAERGDSGRLGLVGRLDSQLLRSEPVIVLATRADGWMKVVAPWHPWARDPRGYVGWIAPGQVSATPWRGATRGGKPVVTPARFLAVPSWRQPVAGSVCPTCGAAPPRPAWTARVWCSGQPARSGCSFLATQPTSSTPPSVSRLARCVPVTCTSSPSLASARTTSGSCCGQGSCSMHRRPAPASASRRSPAPGLELSWLPDALPA